MIAPNPTRMTLTRDDKWDRWCVWVHYSESPRQLLFSHRCYWEALHRIMDAGDNVLKIPYKVLDKPWEWGL